jgi:hypothetical protein
MRSPVQSLSALLVAAALLASSVVCASVVYAKDKPRRAAPEPEFTKSEQILKWINEYRRAPDPERLPEAVKAMGDLGLFRELDQAGVYIGFTAGVLGSNPDKAERLVARMFPMPPEDQVVLIRAIAYSGLPDWKDLLQKFVERMPARQVLLRKYLYGDGKTLREIEIDANVIDTLWGYYFATGSAEPIQRIVGSLSWSNDKNDVEKVTIGSMAKWTLATNASRQKDLLDILAEEMNNQPAEVRRPLREVIEAAETFETGKIRKEAMTAVEELRTKGTQKSRDYAWWGQAGQTALALGCVGAAAGGLVVAGIPCVVGGAISGAALKYFAPEQ